MKLGAQEVEFTSAINHEKEEFASLKVQTADLDQNELTAERLALRPQMENKGHERIRKSAPDGRVSFAKYQASVKDVERALEEDRMGNQHQEQKRGIDCPTKIR